MSKHFLQPCNQNSFPRRRKEAGLTQFGNSRMVFPTGIASPAAGRDSQCLTANALEGSHMLPPLNSRLPLAEEEMPAEGS